MKKAVCFLLAIIIFSISFLITFLEFSFKYGFIPTLKEAFKISYFQHIRSLQKGFLSSLFGGNNNAG